MVNRDTAPKIPLDPSALSMTMTAQGTASGWFGPLTPLAPVAPVEVAGRQFDLVPGYNLQTRPRAGEPIDFAKLRAVADAYDLLRLIIETRKDQVDRMEWVIRPRKESKGKVDPKRVDAIRTFFERPDGEHSFSQWLRLILEDLLVLDAPTIWKQRNLGGELIALHPLDGATIKRVIDDWGRTPLPYLVDGQLVTPPAYQQILKGLPAISYAASEIIYAPRNIRTGRVYGYSPVEQILVTVDIALRRQLTTLNYYTEGNIPSALIGVPDAWTPDQIKSFQDYWDLYFTGDMSARRRAKFVPGGVAKTFIQTQEPELKGVYDEWLAKIVCFAFSISAQHFISQVNRSTANTQKEMSEEEGLVPLLMWVKRLIDSIIAVDLGEPNIEFAWSRDEQIDPVQEAAMLRSLVDDAIITRNMALDRLGFEKSDTPEADELGFSTASGFVYLDETKKPEPPAPVGPDGLPVDPADGSSQPFGSKKGSKPPPSDPEKDKADEKKSAEKEKTVDSEKKVPDPKSRDKVKKLDEMFDLYKNEGHDVSDQPRDNRGRFSSSGGPTYRERQKAERAAEREASGDEDVVSRDNNGRFSGGITYARVRQVAKDVAGDLAFAAGAAAIGAAISAVAPKSGVFGEVMGAAADVSKKTTMALILGAVEQGIATSLRVFGAKAGIANVMARFAKVAIRKGYKKIVGKADESSGLSAMGEENVLAYARMFLPSFLDHYQDQLLGELDDHVDEGHRASAEQGVHEAVVELKEALTGLGKSEASEDLSKGLRKLKPIRQTDAGREAFFQALRKALEKAGKAAATTLAAHLSDTLQRSWDGSGDALAKARAPDPSAARTAADLDLSAIDEIIVDISDALAEAAQDSARRTLVQIGASHDSELTGQASESAAEWARQHAAEMLGKKVLPDGSLQDVQVDGYSITESTRSIVRDTIARGIANGDTLEDIAKAVQENGFSEDRAMEIAENAVADANSAGTLEGYAAAEAAGVQIMKGWKTVGDERVDNDVCKMNEEQGPIPVNQPFQSGHMAPLGHPNCRCSLIAYIGDSEVDDSAEKMLKYSDDEPRDDHGRWTTGAMAASFAGGVATAVSVAAAAYFGRGLASKLVGPLLRRGAGIKGVTKVGLGKNTVYEKEGLTASFHDINLGNYKEVLTGELETLQRFVENTKHMPDSVRNTFIRITKKTENGDETLSHIFGTLSEDGKNLRVHYVLPKNLSSLKDLRDGLNQVGTRGIAIIKDLMAARYPSLEQLSGNRVSGARTDKNAEVVQRISRHKKMMEDSSLRKDDDE